MDRVAAALRPLRGRRLPLVAGLWGRVGPARRPPGGRRRLLAVNDAGERVTALIVLVVVELVAGLTLGHNIERLEQLPGLLLMVPAATSLRGNIFGALGSRLGTAIHAGTFRLSLRPSSTVGENLIASLALTFATSIALAVLAKGAAVVFGVAGSISLPEFVVVSIVGGAMASVAVVVTALALTAGSVRFGWDPDNVTAPLVTAVGDVATVSTLVLAAAMIGHDFAVGAITIGSFVLAPVGAWAIIRSGRRGIEAIIRESLPVLIVGILLDLVAGVTVEGQLSSFALFPALLVLLPAFLALAGALGGTLSSRLSTQLHLGMIAPTRFPEGGARADVASSLVLAVPVFGACGLFTHWLAVASHLNSPGVGWMMASAVLAGVVATGLAALVAYYATIASVRAGLDPDTYGIPLVTSTLDVLGAFTLILAVQALGFT